MSRSYKKTPIIGNAGISDKSYKQFINRRKRRSVRQKLQVGIFDGLDQNIPYDSWDSNKDGKHCFIELKKKNPKFYEELMRK